MSIIILFESGLEVGWFAIRACNTGPISQYRYFGIEKNQYRYTGINTGIQRLPILTGVTETTCKHCIDNDHLMSA